MKMFTAALLLGTVVTVPANAQNSVLFHSGINLSVAPGDADRSQVALATQQAENAQRVAEAAEIGFDFVRLRVPLAPGPTRARRRTNRRR